MNKKLILDKIVADPISLKEQKELLQTSASSIMALQIWHDCMVEDHGDGDMPKMLNAAIEIFTKLRQQWAIAVGNPQEISAETIEKITDAVLRNVQEILKEQIINSRL